MTTPTPPAAAVSATGASAPAVAPETFADVEANSFNAIFERYSRQRSVQANEDVPDSEISADLHMSDFGFNALPLEPSARFVRLSSSRMQVMDRTAATLENQQVDQLILHAAGWSYDRPNLENRRAGSPVEEGSGYDPSKVASILQQYLRGNRQAPHCFVSRRGDIYCLVPWSKATALSVPRQNHADIQDRSITVALEAQYTCRVAAFDARRADLPIALIEPVTAAQISAVSFIARKLMSWSGLTEFPFLDGTLDELSSKLGTGGAHTPGMLAYGAFDYALPDQMLPEMLLPVDWVVGPVDSLPARLKRDAVKPAWTTRIEAAYPQFGFTVGNPASDFARVSREIAGLPAYDFATELFAPPTTARIFEAQAPTGIVTAANERARLVAGEAYQRAADMGASTRTGLYDSATVALDAVVVAALEREARNRSVMDGITHVAIAQSALGFDFREGIWKYLDVPVVPAPGSVTIEGRSVPVPPPNGSRPGGNGP